MSENKKGETVSIQTSRFGVLEVPSASVITLIPGVIGFPDLSRFTLLEYNPPFSWLQSLDRADLAFVVVNAAEFGDDYVVPLPIGDREMDLKESDDVAIINLVSVRPDPTLTTVNLKAPIIVNLRTMRGKQVVLDDARYPVRMQLWVKEEAASAPETEPKK